MCLARLTNVPYGTSWHAFDVWRDHNILTEKILYAKQIIANNKFNLDYIYKLTSIHNHYKIHLLYNRIDFSNLPNPEPLDLSQPLIAVGRIIPKKGFIYLVEAIALLKTQFNLTVKLNIIGPSNPYLEQLFLAESSELKYIQKKIKYYQLEKQIKMLGYLPHQQVLQLINKSSALVMPSIVDKLNNVDGIPNVILEAMAMQKPVIASKVSGIPEVIIDYKTGLLVDPKDASGLAQAIATIFKNKTLAEKMGKQAHQHIMSQFDINQYEKKLSELFENN